MLTFCTLCTYINVDTLTRNFQTYTSAEEYAVMRTNNVSTPSFIQSITISLYTGYSKEGALWEYWLNTFKHTRTQSHTRAQSEILFCQKASVKLLNINIPSRTLKFYFQYISSSRFNYGLCAAIESSTERQRHCNIQIINLLPAICSKCVEPSVSENRKA